MTRFKLTRSRVKNLCLGAVLRASLLIFASSFFPLEIRAQGFKVEGFLNYSGYRRQKPTFSNVKTFAVQVSGCRSLIRTTKEDGSMYSEVAQNEGDLIYVSSSWYVTNGVRKALTSGFIETLPVPRDDSSNIRYLWLAYASGCYFAALTNDLLMPVWVQDSFLDGNEYFLKGVWFKEKEEVAPHLVHYIHQGPWQYSKSDGSQGDLTLSETLSQGFTNATLEVLMATNFHSLSIPTKFVFTRFGVLAQGRNTERTLVTSTTVTVTNVERLPPTASLLPHVDGVLRVLDRRFKNATPPVQFLTYNITNSDWKRREAVVPDYQKQVRVGAG